MCDYGYNARHMSKYTARKKVIAIKPKICYIINTNKKATAHKGLTEIENSNATLRLDQSTRVAFAMYDYLQNVNTNVSNARMNKPNVIKSLKSKPFGLLIASPPFSLE